jgi:hypothetical protein
MNPVVHFEMPTEDKNRMTNNLRVVSRNEWTPEERRQQR